MKRTHELFQRPTQYPQIFQKLTGSFHVLYGGDRHGGEIGLESLGSLYIVMTENIEILQHNKSHEGGTERGHFFHEFQALVRRGDRNVEFLDARERSGRHTERLGKNMHAGKKFPRGKR